MSRLKSELQMLRKRGALKAGSAADDRGVGSGVGGGGGGGGRPGGGDRCCARCRMALGRIMNRGALCKCCRQRVCKACREYNVKATDWVCTVCYKNASVESATGEWMNSFVRRPSRQRLSKDTVDASDIVSRGIRRSWTISNPSSCKDDSYNALSNTTGSRKPEASSPDENRPPTLLRNTPLMAPGVKKRVEARRSVSLSQADVIFYEGVVTASTPSNRMPSRSPQRPPSSTAAAIAAVEEKYRDYYEKKYEKPSSVANNKQQGVDVDTVWKSRWRSTSPPPPLVDDWVPIKPPHLAWAKALPNESIEDRRPLKVQRSKIPISTAAISRSVSGDMIYLERDSDAQLFRQRTLSIDRGMNAAAPRCGIVYKTYEEELHDYHGRTGSVDRLAQRGRPRTIRMGTQVGRSVPVSLERRHSEVGSRSTTTSKSNINRVYIDGGSADERIRVTMTDTRSLKRPTGNTSNSGSESSSTTMPRMSKRPVAAPLNPGTTTVYLGNNKSGKTPSSYRVPSSGSGEHYAPHGTGSSDGAAFQKVAPKRMKTETGYDSTGGRSNKSKASTQTKRASSTSSRGSRTSQSATRIPVATGFRPESATIAVMMQDAAVQTSDNDRHSDILTPEEHPASDSDIGLDADKIHPEGDDYKIVFISSDSSKSSLEGSFDTADAMNSTIHDSTDIVCDSDTAGFIDESDWDFFTSHGRRNALDALDGRMSSPPSSSDDSSRLIQQQQQQQQQQQRHAAPVTYLIDDFNYGWTDKTLLTSMPLNSASGTEETEWSNVVSYATRHVQTDFGDGGPLRPHIWIGRKENSSPTRSLEEWDSSSHICCPPESVQSSTQGSLPRVAPVEHFIPIWQVPSSPRSSHHSTDANDASDAHLLTSQALRQFNRCDSKRSSAERSVEEFNLHDHHIVMGDAGAQGVVSSLYSPEGLALPGFQEYRQQIFTEIQAYTAKGDWNLTSSPPETINVTTHQNWWHQKTQQHQQKGRKDQRWTRLHQVDPKTSDSDDVVSQNVARCRGVVTQTPARQRGSADHVVTQSAGRCREEDGMDDTVAQAGARWRERGENRSQRVDFHWPPGDDTGASPCSPLVSSEATATTTCAANSAATTQQTSGKSEASAGVVSSEISAASRVRNEEAVGGGVTMSFSEDNRPESDEAAVNEKLQQGDSWPSLRSGPEAALEACTVGDLHSLHSQQQLVASNGPNVDAAPVNRGPSPGALSPAPLTDGDAALSPATTPSPVPSGSTPSGDGPLELSGEDGGGGGRTTADDSGDETDPQQETVVEGHGAYHDLRQFALKQSLQAANEHSDTDSSSSRTDGSLRRIAASPSPSDGRLTPRRSQGQYTSYVLITQEKAAKIPAANEQVISDDESGVTVTVPQPADASVSVAGSVDDEVSAAAASSVVCVVEVPAALADASSWPESPRADGSDSEPELGNSEATEESGSCISSVTISGNSVLTDNDLLDAATTDDETPTDGHGVSKLAKYFTYELEADYTTRRKQPVVYRNPERNRSSSPDPFSNDPAGVEDVSFSSDDPASASLNTTEEQDTLQYESDPSEGLDSVYVLDDSFASDFASSGDEACLDQEEELRGYCNRAIDFTLHTILEESCEESDGGGERRSHADERSGRGDPSELEKYYTLGLSGCGTEAADATKRRSFANEESEYSDTFSETSSSIYSEGLDPAMQTEEVPTDPVELASSRLEKYFMTNFLGLDGAQYPFPVPAGRGADGSSDGSVSVGSDSEGQPSPEQRRRKVMKARGSRQQASGMSGIADWGRSGDRSYSGTELNDAEDLDATVCPAPLDASGRISSSASESDVSTSEEEEEIVMEKTDGQFDTIKRRKKKRTVVAEFETYPLDKTVAIIEDPPLPAPDQAAAAPPPSSPPPPPAETLPAASDPSASVSETLPAVEVELASAGLDPNCPRKYQSRDSGFVGSCDDLLNEAPPTPKEIRQRLSSESGSSDADAADKKPEAEVAVKPDESDSKSGKSVGSSGSSGGCDRGGSLKSGSGGKLSRKDSFNNWSSDEETNLMMNKMRAFFRNMVSGSGSKADGENGERIKPPQLVVFETELTRLMKSVPGINDQQVKEIVEYLSSEDTWSDSYDSSDYTSSDLEGAYAVLDPSSGIPELSDGKSDLQQQISASCQEIIEKFDLDRSPEGSHMHINTAVPWLPAGSDTEASGSLNKETAFVYQRLVNSLMRLNSTPKSTTAAPASAAALDADVEEDATTPHHSPPMIAKVLHHIGNRLVALMHEVSASSDTTSHSGSIDEDAQSAGRMKELRLAAHFQEPVTSSPRLTKLKGRLFANKDCGSPDEKRSLSTSISSEETPTDTEHSPDSDESHTNRKRNAEAGSIKFGFESLHTYEKRMSSLPAQPSNRAADSDFRGFSSLESAESRGLIGGSRSLKARLTERARTLEAERRRLAEEKRMAEEQPDHNAQEEDPADEDRFYKKARKLPRFSLFRTARSQESRSGGGSGGGGGANGGGVSETALQSSSSGVSDIAEEKEDEFCGWRSSFESAIAADSRTKLSLEAKRRSAGGSASSSELFASSEQLLLDRGDSRRGVRSSGHSSKFSLPNLLERDAVRMAKERERERSASSDVLLSTSPVASNAHLNASDQQNWDVAEDEDCGWDRLMLTRLSSKRRSSVPDTREERSAEEPRSTTLPRSATALNTVTQDNDPASISASTAGVKKSLSLLLTNSANSTSCESSLNTSVDTPVRSARYRPPGFRSPQADTTPRMQPRTPPRAPSAPSLTPRSSSSVASSLSSRKTIRSMLADERREGGTSSSPSFVREGLRTSMASAASGESFSSVSATDTIDESDLSPPASNKSIRSSSLSALGTRSDSMASVYSASGENRYGTVAVRGEIQFGLHYNYRQTTLEVFVKQSRDLAPVDIKRNRSDPYAKVYLLPDRSKSGKRKTKVKKHTLSPMFDENLKFTASLSDLENRTLWLTVWHSDMFGRNDFLGEVLLPLAGRIFDDPTPHWYQLQERSEIIEDPSLTALHRGDVIVALKYVPSESSPVKKSKAKSKGSLHVLVKEAKGLIAVRPNGNIDALCKGNLIPEKSKSSKSKTNICRRTSNPVWNSTLIFEDVNHQELKERALELNIWNHDRLATKEFLGGVRLNLGTGLCHGKPVEWMDAMGIEVTLWQSVVERAGLWVEGSLPLRISMERPVGE